MIERTLIRLGIQYRVDRSLVRNDISAGVSFHFGLFEVLLNLEPIFHSLFIYYPKRRNLFVKRLFKQPSVRYLLGRKESLAAPARSSLLAFNLHNKNTRNLLKKLESEVKSSKN